MTTSFGLGAMFNVQVQEGAAAQKPTSVVQPAANPPAETDPNVMVAFGVDLGPSSEPMTAEKPEASSEASSTSSPANPPATGSVGVSPTINMDEADEDELFGEEDETGQPAMGAPVFAGAAASVTASTPRPPALPQIAPIAPATAPATKPAPAAATVAPASTAQAGAATVPLALSADVAKLSVTLADANTKLTAEVGQLRSHLSDKEQTIRARDARISSLEEQVACAGREHVTAVESERHESTRQLESEKNNAARTLMNAKVAAEKTRKKARWDFLWIGIGIGALVGIAIGVLFGYWGFHASSDETKSLADKTKGSTSASVTGNAPAKSASPPPSAPSAPTPPKWSHPSGSRPQPTDEIMSEVARGSQGVDSGTAACWKTEWKKYADSTAPYLDCATGEPSVTSASDGHGGTCLNVSKCVVVYP